MQRSKTYRAAEETFDRDELYSPLTAIKIAKDTSKKKFDESVDVVMRLGVDPRIGSGRYHRATVRARAFLHPRERVVVDRDEPYRRRCRELADCRNGHAADQEKPVERAILDVCGGDAGAQVLGGHVFLGKPGSGQHDAGVG